MKEEISLDDNFDLDAALSEIDAAEDARGDIADEIEAMLADSSENMQTLEKAIASDEMRHEVYAKQLEDNPDALTEVAVKSEAAAAPKAKRAPRAPGATVSARVGELVKDGQLTLVGPPLAGEGVLDLTALDDAGRQERTAILLDRLSDLPKKTQDKAVNLVQHLVSGAKLSRYTELAIDTALAKDSGIVHMVDLKQVYADNGYRPGTANAQAGQLKGLLVTVGMLKPTGVRGEFTIERDHPLTQKLSQKVAA